MASTQPLQKDRNDTRAADIAEAVALLEAAENDAAIDVLRRNTINDARVCALIARAYFQRGDAKGDIYTSHYFARRALQLGSDDPEVPTIQAIGAFRKEQFEEAIEVFESFVDESSLPATKLIYGLALYREGQDARARRWIDSALADRPDNEHFAAVARQVAKHRQNGADPASFVPASENMFATAIDTLKARSDKNLDSPFKSNAVSKLRGYGTAPKDFDWLNKNIPCQEACPAGTDIPGYLSAIYNGDYDRAYHINLADNVFPAVLGRVCSRPCEAACRHGWDGLGDSVAICWSKRSGADFKNKNPVVLEKLYAPTGKKIAVIGSGVAGLAAARNLALLGHQITVYEKHSKPGGMMNQGIPEFRLPRDIIDREIDQVRGLGVEIVCNTSIGVGAVGGDVSMAKLVEDFDAVVMAAGTLRPNLLNLPGKELDGIRHGLDFLLEANETQQAKDFGKDVVVIGGGFTAMDCARTAWRLGGKVRVLYRRGKDEMLITPGELEELENEGIPMEFFVSPIGYVDDEHGRVKAMCFIRTELGEPDASGRRRPVDIPGSEFELPCDQVLLATGQFPDTSWMDAEFKELMVADDGWLKRGDAQTTDHAKVFVAGDFATGARTLIEAIGHAKDGARKVDEFLMGEERLFDVAEVSETPKGSGRIREMDAVPLQHMPVIPIHERKLTTEVETGYTREDAPDEAQRCYMCHYKYEIDPEKCIYCDWCIKVKPRPNCIVEIKDLVYDEQDRIIDFVRAENTEEVKQVWINQEDCIRCNACVDACPVDCISVQKVSLRTVTKDGTALD